MINQKIRFLFVLLWAIILLFVLYFSVDFIKVNFEKKDPSSIKPPFRPLLKIRTEVNSLNWKERNKMRIYLFPGTMFGGLKKMYYWRLAKHEQCFYYLCEGKIAQRNKKPQKKEFIIHAIISWENAKSCKAFLLCYHYFFLWFWHWFEQIFAHTHVLLQFNAPSG